MSAAAVTGSGDTGVWPDLTLAEWEDTRDTLHMWTQIVGKVRLALEPMVNHWWQVPLYVSARGLTTSLMHAEGRGLELEFDFLDHALHVRTSDGGEREVALAPRTVAELLRGDHGRAARISTCTCRSSPVRSRSSRRSRSPDDQRGAYDAGCGATLLARARAGASGDDARSARGSSAR